MLSMIMVAVYWMLTHLWSDVIMLTVYWTPTHLWSDAITLTVYWTPTHLWYDARVSNRIISQSSSFEFVSLSSPWISCTHTACKTTAWLTQQGTDANSLSRSPNYLHFSCSSFLLFFVCCFFSFPVSSQFLLPSQPVRHVQSHGSLGILHLEHKASTCITYRPWPGTQSINVHHILSFSWNTKHQMFKV